MDSMARKLTLESINQQIAKLQQQAAAIVDAEKAEVIDRIKLAIAHYDITAADLGLSAAVKSNARKAGKKAKVAAKPASTRIKYRDDAGHSWSGMGRKPRWFIEALASGKSEPELRA
jgi:DNA-binding protein H-NS